MNLLAPVSDIMTKDVIYVSPEDSLDNVRELFEKKSIHHLPVVSSGKLVGMVSKSDYLFFSKSFMANEYEAFLEKLRNKNHKVKDLMVTRLAKLDPTDKVNVALEVFRVNKFHALPVTDGDRLVGILTTFDIIDYLAKDEGADKSYK